MFVIPEELLEEGGVDADGRVRREVERREKGGWAIVGKRRGVRERGNEAVCEGRSVVRLSRKKRAPFGEGELTADGPVESDGALAEPAADPPRPLLEQDGGPVERGGIGNSVEEGAFALR